MRSYLETYADWIFHVTFPELLSTKTGLQNFMHVLFQFDQIFPPEKACSICKAVIPSKYLDQIDTHAYVVFQFMLCACGKSMNESLHAICSQELNLRFNEAHSGLNVIDVIIRFVSMKDQRTNIKVVTSHSFRDVIYIHQLRDTFLLFLLVAWKELQWRYVFFSQIACIMS